MIKVMFLAVTLSACATLPNYDLPGQVVEWSNQNVVKLLVTRDDIVGGGSGFWVDGWIMTACHAVKDATKVFIQSATWKYTALTETVKCDTGIDLALLKVVDDDDLGGFVPLPTHIAEEMPSQTKALYGPGYPMGGRLIITRGDMQLKYDDGYRTTVLTMFGDSGRPVIMLTKGRISVVGVIDSVQTIQYYSGGAIPISHMAGMKGVEDIRSILDD